MEQNVKEIDSIVFGVYSTEEIKKMGVCKIDNPKKTGYNTVYDERMGPCDSCVKCETCTQNIEKCPGHFGYIELNERIVHPLFYKRVIAFLNCFCLSCGRLLLIKDQINLYGLNKYKGESRFVKIQEKLKKIDMCCHENCGSDQPKCKFSTTDNSIYKVYETREKNKTSIILTTDEIKKIFDNIIDEDIELMGFDPELVHPKNLIMEILPVLPICDRPFVKADCNLCDDDLTNQYVEIIKINNNLAPEIDSQGITKELPETKRQKLLASLRFRILTTFNNGQGKAKHTTNGRAIKGIKERLSGKNSQLRGGLMGKRSLLLGTKVLGFNGICKNVEDIMVGDIVIGDDGSPRTVIDTLRGTSKIYTVKQTKGEDYGISCEHILTLYNTCQGKISWCNSQSNYGGWVIAWYDRDTKTFHSKKSSIVIGVSKDDAYKILVDFKESINCDPVIDIHVEDYLKLATKYRTQLTGIKLNVPIKWEHKPIPIDPRILGMWLGDGGSYRSTFTNPDKELIEYFSNWCKKYKGNLTSNKDNLHHHISNCNFLQLLKDLNVYDNKHIPEEYIINDEETRLLILAGLIDTDGSVEQNGIIVRITQCNEHKVILDGAQSIARSLGFRTEMHVKKTTWTSGGEIKKDTACILTICGNIGKIPTLIPRKKCVSSTNKINNYKIEVVDAGIGDFYGFEVDKNNRFLLGDCTITHNCNQTGRTVIGPDPTLKLGEIALPPEMAEILTIPIKVALFNIELLQKMVNNGKVEFLIKPDGKTRINLKRYRNGTRLCHGDIIFRGDEKIEICTGRELVLEGDRVERNGEPVDKLLPINRQYNLEIGWTVERQLQDGDYVILNRQPTLHKASMMAMQILIKPGKTIRMNLACTKGYNADFDGDEIDVC